MNIFILIVGIVLLIIGGICLARRYSLRNQVWAIAQTDTSQVAELRSLAESITTELGNSGSWRERVEVKGAIKCSNPLTANISQQPCVYCHSKVTEKYEEVSYETDDEGNTHCNTSTKTRTLDESTIRINFLLEDNTGTILIDPNRAEIEAIVVVDRFERGSHNDLSLSWGQLNLNLSSHSRDGRTLGYRYYEEILPIDTQIYVLGEISDLDNQLAIRASQEKKKPFLITYKSEEELMRSKQSNANSDLIWGSIFFLLGAVLSVFAILSLLTK